MTARFSRAAQQSVEFARTARGHRPRLQLTEYRLNWNSSTSGVLNLVIDCVLVVEAHKLIYICSIECTDPSLNHFFWRLVHGDSFDLTALSPNSMLRANLRFTFNLGSSRKVQMKAGGLHLLLLRRALARHAPKNASASRDVSQLNNRSRWGKSKLLQVAREAFQSRPKRVVGSPTSHAYS